MTSSTLLSPPNMKPQSMAGMNPLPSTGYMIPYPTSMYMIEAIAKSAMFLVKISAVFLARTIPASSMAKPAAIHMTSAPEIRK